MIDKFADDFPQVNLAVSLHAPSDEKRGLTMPVNKKYSLTELIPACRRYTAKTGRRITFEYAVVDSFNDSDEDVSELAGLLKGMLCHVNLIPLNEIKSENSDVSGSTNDMDTTNDGREFANGSIRLRAGSRKRAKEIAMMLESSGIPATVRRSLGRDIDAACGQLRLNNT